MAQVVVTITTKPQDFPPGTVGGVMRVTINNGLTQDITGLTATFADVSPGDYVVDAKLLDANGAQLGDPISASFNVPVPIPVPVTLQVPASLSVTVG